VRFADRTNAARTLLFHHDPQHTDEELDAIFEDAQGRWREAGHTEEGLGIAAEGDEFTVALPKVSGAR
jgi:phosphoribosyl 1,2-cyclic phosphodiesterase